MVVNYFEKDEWDEQDWAVYLNNLAILAATMDLTKSKLSLMVGRGNLFRRDMRRPAKDTIFRICQKCQITEEWLLTPRKNVKEYLRQYKDTGSMIRTTATGWDGKERRRGQIERRTSEYEYEVCAWMAEIKALDRRLFLQTAHEVNARRLALLEFHDMNKKSGKV